MIIAELWRPEVERRWKNKQFTNRKIVPRTTTTMGMRSFAVAGPIISSLPAALRAATLSPLTFARHLKAHLFGWSAARLRTIYDALYKSTHHHHHHHHQQWCEKMFRQSKHAFQNVGPKIRRGPVRSNSLNTPIFGPAHKNDLLVKTEPGISLQSRPT